MQTNNKVAILFSFIITQVEHLIGRQTWLPWAERRKEISKKTKKISRGKFSHQLNIWRSELVEKKRIIDGPSCFEQKKLWQLYCSKTFFCQRQKQTKNVLCCNFKCIDYFSLFALFLLSQITIILIFWELFNIYLSTFVLTCNQN